MAEFKDMLKYFRSRDGLSQSDLAKQLGVSTSTISMYEVGKREPDFETEEKIADFFNTDLNILRGRDTECTSSNGGVVIPVLGRVAAGIPITAAEYVIDTEEISEEMSKDGEYFGLKIKGDSMEPRFTDGDVVIVRKQSDADDGDIVIALVNNDNDAVVKRLKKYAEGIALISTNPAYDPLIFNKEQIEKKPVQIVGKVKELRAKF